MDNDRRNLGKSRLISHRLEGGFFITRRREDLNLRRAFKTLTSLAVRRTRPDYATSPMGFILPISVRDGNLMLIPWLVRDRAGDLPGRLPLDALEDIAGRCGRRTRIGSLAGDR